MITDARNFLKQLFSRAVAAGDPATAMAAILPGLDKPKGRRVVLGMGKAGIAMARAANHHWPEASGLIVVPHGVPGTDQDRIGRIRVLTAAHPIPDEASIRAGEALLQAAARTASDDFVLFLISGGGSALACASMPPVTLADKRSVTRALLASGAPIDAINCVRKHLSAIKGGRLAALCAAPSLTLAISDVTGDDPATIASGPTQPDPTTRGQALDVLNRYSIGIPDHLATHLNDPKSETPKPDDPRFARAKIKIIASPAQALASVAAEAAAHAVAVLNLGADITGDARMVARDHAALALQIAAGQHRLKPPVLILSGGETTVRLNRPKGPTEASPRGGRNSHYSLALCLALDGHPAIHALAADTDGIDGIGGHAGALIDPTTLIRARALGLDPISALARCASYDFFVPLDDLLLTGPTGTNLNDFRAILIC